MSTKIKSRNIAIGTLAVLGATTLGGFTVKPAEASSSTWKKVAIGAGVVSAYGLLKGNNDLAAIGGVVAVGSLLKSKADRKKEKARAREEDRNRYRYQQRYDRGRNYRR